MTTEELARCTKDMGPRQRRYWRDCAKAEAAEAEAERAAKEAKEASDRAKKASDRFVVAMWATRAELAEARAILAHKEAAEAAAAQNDDGLITHLCQTAAMWRIRAGQAAAEAWEEAEMWVDE